MSNEELAITIQAGSRDKMLELWERVEHFIRLQANCMARKVDGRYGVTAEDFYQCGFFALVAAVDSFSIDAGCSFISWLTYYLRREFAACGGWRSERQKSDPLQHAVSLSAPVDNCDPDGTTLEELLECEAAKHGFEAVEDSLWREQLHKVLETTMEQIPGQERAVLRLRYFDAETLVQIAAQRGVSTERVRQLEARALHSMREADRNGALAQFIEARTPYYLQIGPSTFNRTQTSAVEKIVLLRERMRAQLLTNRHEKEVIT